MTTDKFLTSIITYHSPYLKSSIESRDYNIINNLASCVTNDLFITEKQATLLLTLLSKHSELIETEIPDIKTQLETPTWSKPFRIIEQHRTLKLNTDSNVIEIEFTYSAEIRNTLHNINKISSVGMIAPGKSYIIDFTEQNVILIIDELKKYQFEVDSELMKYYNQISSWDYETVKATLDINNISNEKLKTMLIEDIGEINLADPLIIQDRSIKYQYFTGLSKTNNTLVENIAFRDNSHIWVDSSQNSMTELLSSLQQLNRFPVLFLFDDYNSNDSYLELSSVGTALDELNITENIGIYFRMKDVAKGKLFNEYIANKKYNSKLDTNTLVAGITKIPKFFLTSEWKPMSVIVLGSRYRTNKSGIYANRCDLIIDYSPQKSIISENILSF